MLELCITNLGKYNEGFLIYERLELPYTEEELKKVLDKIGINEEYEEWFISDYETELDIKISEYENLEKLNDNISELMDLNEDIEVINGIIGELGDDLEVVISTLSGGNYSILNGITSYFDLGFTLAEEIYNIDTSSYINTFLDYSSLGEQSDYCLIGGDMAISIY